jgi:hypothetical protein
MVQMLIICNCRNGRRQIFVPDHPERLSPAPRQLRIPNEPAGSPDRASFTDNGSIQVDDGRSFSSPSRAAMEAAGVASYDGWYAWRVDAHDGKLLHDLRTDLLQKSSAEAGAAAEADSVTLDGAAHTPKGG